MIISEVYPVYVCTQPCLHVIIAAVHDGMQSVCMSTQINKCDFMPENTI